MPNLPRNTPHLTVEEIREVVALASYAPSVHNTQPWRFEWNGRALAVDEDRSRSLPVLDPTGRERILSCGAAAQHAELAFRAHVGRECSVDVLPDPARPDRIAALVPGPPASAGQAEALLLAAIPRRYTDRGMFLPQAVPAAAVDRLRTAAEHHGAWLRPVDRPDEQIALAVLLAHADAHERSDPAYLEELATWRTRNREQEGVPDAAVPAPDAPPRGSDFTLRDFSAGAPPPPTHPADDDPPTPEHPLVVVIGTHDDSPDDWARAGMALGRVLLQATVDGLTASPMTQVVEVERFRAALRHDLGLVGMPQIVLRIGYGQGRMTTRRRPVEDVLSIRA